jgi:hypothetical protein
MPTYVDITADDLHALYMLARRHASARLGRRRAVGAGMAVAVGTVDLDATRHVLVVVSDADLLALAPRLADGGCGPRLIPTG